MCCIELDRPRVLPAAVDDVLGCPKACGVFGEDIVLLLLLLPNVAYADRPASLLEPPIPGRTPKMDEFLLCAKAAGRDQVLPGIAGRLVTLG